MQIYLALFLIGSSVQAMNHDSLNRSESPPVSTLDEMLDFGRSFLKRFQTSQPVVQPQPQEQAPLFIELLESPPRSPFLLGEAIVGRRIPDSPPKSPLQEEAVLGDRIPRMPTLFRITNKSSIGVHIVAVLTAPYRPKKYIFQPGDSMIIMSPDPRTAQFEQVYVPQQEENTHLAGYVFKDSMYVMLVILKHPQIQEQLCISKKGY